MMSERLQLSQHSTKSLVTFLPSPHTYQHLQWHENDGNVMISSEQMIVQQY